MIHHLKNIALFVLPFLITFLLGCENSKHSIKNTPYVIGRDPTWYPLDLMGKEQNVYGFSTDLMHAIAKEENLSMELAKVGWNQLIPGLKNHSYDAVLSSITPTPINEANFDFSISFLDLGPVLIVRQSTNARSLEDLKEKVVGVSAYNNDEMIVQQVASIIIKPYDNLGLALNDLSLGILDGAVMGKIIAETYLKDLYQDQLKIVTPPLSQKGLRLMSLHGEEAGLLEIFNRGIEIVKKKGIYDDLLHKWNLDY